MANQPLIIRTDANTTIGTGHFMRCLALAQEWKKEHGDVYFFMANPSEAIQHRLLQENIQLFFLHSSSGTIADAEETAQHANRLHARWMILDGYHFQSFYQTKIQSTGLNILYIDDHNHADFYVANIVLNQNIYANQEFYPNRSDITTLLLGSQYVLLRDEFIQCGSHQKQIPQVARRILISFGGGDQYNMTKRVLEELLPVNNIEVKALIGPFNPFETQLHELNEQHSNIFQLLHHIDNMPSLMSWADVAIVSGGISNYELFFMGLPFLAIITAKNHEELVNYLGNHKMAINCGWYNQLLHGSFTDVVRDFLMDHSKRSHFSASGKNLIDGRGARRVIQTIMTIN